MANKNNIFDLVETYLNGEFDAKELANFELQLKSNIELQSQLKKAQAAQKLVLQNRLLQVKSLANDEFNRIDNNSSFQKYFFIGGLALITTVSGIWYLNKIEETKSTPKKPVEIIIKQKIDTSKSIEQKTNVITTNNTSSEHSHKLKEEYKEVNTQEKTTPTLINQEKEEKVISENQESKIVEPISDNTPPIERKTICNPENIDAQIHTIIGCAGKNENGIEIGKITGLNPPINIEILDNNNEAILSKYNLKDGIYQVVISNSENCKKVSPITLEGKNCPIEIDFNPNLGEVWDIPTNQLNGVLTIYTKTGLEVIQKTITANEALSWDGKNKNEVIQTGYFIFTINYEDGSFLKGGITVTQ